MKLFVLVTACFAGAYSAGQTTSSKPNVVVIMADDLGFNDVSFRGANEIPTENIDALAYSGVILNRFYTPPLCTPSRSSFLTGKYPHRIGMQHYVIPSSEPWALGKEEKLLPEYFKDAGYKTALVGKWHLGFYQKKYTPTFRGFDSHFGYLGPYIDYFNYTLKDYDHNYARGFDMRRNLTVANDFEPIYATNLFTNEAIRLIKTTKKQPLFLLLNHLAPHAGNEDDPLQAPKEEIDKFSYIVNTERRTLAAMISVLDQGVGAVVSALKESNMLDNTIIVFYSDNGGPTIGLHSTNASNFPLRGQKESGWEGGTRTNAIFWASFLKKPGVVRNQLMHVSDLFPTLLKFAGIKFDSRLKLDGVDQWDMINEGVSQRDEIVNIDDVFGYGSIIFRDYKLVNGTSGPFNGWLASSNKNGDNDPISYANRIISSPVAQAISSVMKGKQITPDKIFELRKKATVKCANPNMRSACDVTKAPCLFHIYNDPCEENNLAGSFWYILKLAEMKLRYEDVRRQTVPTRRKPNDPECDPKYFNFSDCDFPGKTVIFPEVGGQLCPTWNWWQTDS